jgi:hypothetical protein
LSTPTITVTPAAVDYFIFYFQVAFALFPHSNCYNSILFATILPRDVISAGDIEDALMSWLPSRECSFKGLVVLDDVCAVFLPSHACASVAIFELLRLRGC